MAFSKIILNGTTLIDLTSDTVATDNLISPNTAHNNAGLSIVGTASGGGNDFIVTLSYNSQTEMWEPDCTYQELYGAYIAERNIVAKVDETMYDYYTAVGLSYTGTYFGYTVFDGQDGNWWSYIFDSTGVQDDGNTQYISPYFQTVTKTYTPTESQQTETVTFDTSQYYNGLQEVDVTVNAISSTYVGTGITRRSSSDLTASGATVTVPSGYYSAQATKSVSATTHPDPSVSISTTTGLITASHTQTAGYVSAGTTTDTLQLSTQSATTITPSTSAQTAVSAGKYTTGAVTVAAMPSGTAGTPTATKGTVSNHSVSVTPSVTNTTGYITGSTKTGTAVTVSASELVSGSQNITTNNTYDVTNLASVVVNVSGGSSMNAQSAQSTTRATSSTYTKCVSLTCSKAGTYDVYWSTFRSSTSGTSGSQLYVDGSAYGTADTTTWSNHIQNMHLTGVSIGASEEVAVYARSRGNNYYSYVGTLTIIQTA